MNTRRAAGLCRRLGALLRKVLGIFLVRSASIFCGAIASNKILKLWYAVPGRRSPRDEAWPPKAVVTSRNGCPIPERLRNEEEQETATKCDNNGNNPRKAICKLPGLQSFALEGWLFQKTYQNTQRHDRLSIMTALTRGIKFLPPSKSSVYTPIRNALS